MVLISSAFQYTIPRVLIIIFPMDICCLSISIMLRYLFVPVKSQKQYLNIISQSHNITRL